MLDALFAWLFKYRPVVFEQGEIGLSPSRASAIAAVLLIVGGGFAAYAYWRRAPASTTSWARAGLLTLRLMALGLVAVCLLRPVLIVKAAVNQQNFVAVLLDESRSMQVADVAGDTRGAFVRGAFGGETSPIVSALQQRFAVRTFRFANTPDRLPPGGELAFAGSTTRIDRALDRARDELQGLPVAGVILVSDGGDSSGSALDDARSAMKAAGIPVFAVGVGSESLDTDIQVGRIAAPRTVLKGTTLVTDVLVSQRGFAGRAVTLNVEDEGRILGTESVTLAADGEPQVVRLRYTVDTPGPRRLQFRVPPEAGELLVENNVREAFVEVEDRKEKILYVEGEPRFEVKFIRRAVADDDNLQLVVLQRTAENKYLRLGVRDGDELASGFPRTREELFAYRGIILGSLEASALSGDQLRMLSDFVDRRGGGLVALGGRRAFGEGGYAGTPVADALPVLFEGSGSEGDAPPLARLTVTPTRAGLVHPVTQLARTEREAAERWRALPPLSSVNVVERAKPGATVLLSGRDESRAERIVLAHQRFGRGKAIAFAVQDSWLWQMHAQIDVKDQTHETLWRQLLRWAAEGVPSQVEATTSNDRVEPGERVAITAQVADAGYVAVNSAHVVATISQPGGGVAEQTLTWTGERDGEYRGEIATSAEGEYEVHVEASRNGEVLGADRTFVLAAPGDGEFTEPTLRRSLLEGLATETGGRYYSTETVQSLPEDIKYTGRGVTSTEERDLWDMPLVLLALLGLVLGEWSWRRRLGLP